ncbi:hypothetical protein BPAE_0202g00180 [Botrytis paeoniae]|uniref:protein-ribulosamine 3-kinase n=1 Tax=Botrytis paeoniae TaxID=278948 RepID=A0A4Z1FJ60_9HELO|nr:hypothetical protein BPAE_0202g00180 [Botrytis paeoniae]
MSSKVDPAISKALSLDPSSATISKHGGGGFARTFKISGTVDETQKFFFVKTGGRDSEEMFRGEHASLNAIHSIVPSLCPQSYANGPLELGGGFFLATDFLDLNPRDAKSTSGSGESLARKLAKLHSVSAPIPEGYEQPQFGFPVTTCCGETKQDNSFKESWAEFYGDNRLRGIVEKAENNNGKDGELRKLVEEVVEIVVPRLLGDENLRGSDGQKVKPVVVHGDLWSGNHGTGRIGEGGVEEVVYDSSASWSHAEFEAGIMRMFGGFGSAFWREYHEVRPMDEPREEWEDRCALYELYHHLNHYAMFGGGYKGGAMNIMRRLLQKYGEET